MRMTALFAILLFAVCSAAQSVPRASNNAMPDLEHFSPDQVDKSLDPCSDFFQYACSKWVKANPIPADQATWGTFNKLAIWNTAAIRNTLEQVSSPDPKRNAVDQKAGDHYASCMDEATINKAGIAPLKPDLDRIAALKNKAQLPELIASLHQIVRPANLNFIDAQYQGILFGIYNGPQFDDARMNIGVLDQSGMNMPSREFYLNDDEKSKEIRQKYVAHVGRMLELAGGAEGSGGGGCGCRSSHGDRACQGGDGYCGAARSQEPGPQTDHQRSAGAYAFFQLEPVFRGDADVCSHAVPGAVAGFLSRGGETDCVGAGGSLAGVLALLAPTLVGLVAVAAVRGGKF